MLKRREHVTANWIKIKGLTLVLPQNSQANFLGLKARSVTKGSNIYIRKKNSDGYLTNDEIVQEIREILELVDGRQSLRVRIHLSEMYETDLDFCLSFSYNSISFESDTEVTLDLEKINANSKNTLMLSKHLSFSAMISIEGLNEVLFQGDTISLGQNYNCMKYLIAKGMRMNIELKDEVKVLYPDPITKELEIYIRKPHEDPSVLKIQDSDNVEALCVSSRIGENVNVELENMNALRKIVSHCDLTIKCNDYSLSSVETLRWHSGYPNMELLERLTGLKFYAGPLNSVILEHLTGVVGIIEVNDLHNTRITTSDILDNVNVKKHPNLQFFICDKSLDEEDSRTFLQNNPSVRYGSFYYKDIQGEFPNLILSLKDTHTIPYTIKKGIRKQNLRLIAKNKTLLSLSSQSDDLTTFMDLMTEIRS